jgi:hypothetical protein
MQERSTLAAQKLREFADLFGATISITDGRLNYATFALVLEQALTMSTVSFQERLDYIYPTISYDNFAFIECLYKINIHVNSPTKQSEATRKNLLSTVAQIRAAIIETEESDDISLSITPKIGWRNRLSVKPAKKSIEEEVHNLIRQTRRNNTQPRNLSGLLRVLFVFDGEVIDAEQDCGNPACPFNHSH